MANNNPFSEIPTNTIMFLRQNRDIQDRQLNELKARIARLEEGVSDIAGKPKGAHNNKVYIAKNYTVQDMIDRLNDLANETPRQSLNEIKADAVECAANIEFYLVMNEPAIMRNDLLNYANQLRNKGGI